MSALIQAWQCIGCGKLQAEAPCVGICQDRQVELVSAGDYEALFNANQNLESRVESLMQLIRKLALVTPRPGKAEQTLLTLQQQAKNFLRATDGCLPEISVDRETAGR